MKIIGITGGIGVGKSSIMELLADEFGAYTIMADLIGHQLMEIGQINYNELIKVFGEDILKPDKNIDRGKLSSIIFSDKDQLKTVNAIVHPNVKKEIKSLIAKAIESQQYSIIAIEAALLLEDNYREICDELWYIYARKEIRVERLVTSRGYTLDKIQTIMASQMPDEEFMKQCEHTVDNSGTLQGAKRQIIRLISDL